jgi:hypothetical protein
LSAPGTDLPSKPLYYGIADSKRVIVWQLEDRSDGSFEFLLTTGAPGSPEQRTEFREAGDITRVARLANQLALTTKNEVHLVDLTGGPLAARTFPAPTGGGLSIALAGDTVIVSTAEETLLINAGENNVQRVKGPDRFVAFTGLSRGDHAYFVEYGEYPVVLSLELASGRWSVIAEPDHAVGLAIGDAGSLLMIGKPYKTDLLVGALFDVETKRFEDLPLADVLGSTNPITGGGFLSGVRVEVASSSAQVRGSTRSLRNVGACKQ